ncbi:MAG: hypothetical protein WA667_17395 [Candidatus Nitrosopolaris sp.]
MGGFWTSLPGIRAGAGTSLGAIVAFYALLHWGGHGSGTVVNVAPPVVNVSGNGSGTVNTTNDWEANCLKLKYNDPDDCT